MKKWFNRILNKKVSIFLIRLGMCAIILSGIASLITSLNSCRLSNPHSANTIGKKSNIKTITVKEGGHLRLLQNYSPNGDLIFEKNDSMNGPVIMISGYQYDSIHRQTRFMYAHSNVGFSISDYKYEPFTLKQFDYTTDVQKPGKKNPGNDSSVAASSETFNSFISVENINSLSDLEKSNEILKLLKARKFLKKVSLLDANHNVVSEIFFNLNGDTTDIGYHYYNTRNQETDVQWTSKTGQDNMDDHYDFDSSGNMVKYSRIYYRNAKKDTSEKTLYTYSPSHKKIMECEISDGGITGKTIYTYDSHGLETRETYYNYGEDDRKAVTLFYYDTYGRKIIEVFYDYFEHGSRPKYVYTTRYDYW